MSFQSLVRSTILIGSSSAATTVVGILRVKAMALMVGPTGVGLLGVLAAMTSAGTTLTALGSDTSGTRRIALASDACSVARVRRTLLLVAVCHGLAATVGIWLCREPLAEWLLGSRDHATAIGLTGVAVALSLIAGLQIAQLQGLGQVRDIARINLAASVAGTCLGIGAVWAFGLPGLVLLVLAQPAIAALLASIGTWGLGKADRDRPVSPRQDFADWWAIVSHGAPFMLSFLVTAAAPLAIRALVARDLGMEAAGHFHAAWTLSAMYVAFLLSAMSVDYFPRLTAVAGDRDAARRLVNQQTQLVLAIGGVVLLGVLATAPILVPLLYSRAFGPAIEIVEWQALGNLMKIAGWPIGYLLLARGRSTLLIATELAWNGVLVALAWGGLPHLGVAATGVAFAIASSVFLMIHLAVGRAVFGICLDRSTLGVLGLFLAAGLVVFGLARTSQLLQLLVGCGLTAGLGLISLRLIAGRIEGHGRLVTLVRKGFASLGWPMPAPLSTERS